MKLQLAIDLLSVPDALSLLHKVAPYVDVIELGTPLIKQEGMNVVTDIKAAYPEKLVFADMKTMDAGELEADIAFKAGADIMTVLGLAGDSTIAGSSKGRQGTWKGGCGRHDRCGRQTQAHEGTEGPGRELGRAAFRSG